VAGVGASDQHVEEAETDESSQPKKQRTSKQTKWARKVKKSPHAPKRFKSPYIIFSAQKHKEIQRQLARLGIQEKVRAANVFSKIARVVVVGGVFEHQYPSSPRGRSLWRSQQ
jgi:hypothetical protein